MLALNDLERPAKRRALFEELRQAHAQAETAAINGRASSFGEQSAFVAESRKAADIVARIRTLDAL